MTSRHRGDRLGARAVPSRRRGGMVAAVGALLALAVGAGSPAPAVTVDESYWLSAGSPVVVHGHGYGHGHGMSQYGAEGAARAGLSADQILAFYYPGTTPAAARGRIRVLVTADTSDDVVVSPIAGLAVRDRGARTTYPLPDVVGVSRWRLTVAGASPVVEHLSAGAWHRWLPAGVSALKGDLQFQTDGGPMTLWTPSGSAVYRGKLRAASPGPDSTDRDTVNVVRLDDYVQGVIPYEMPASWTPAAVQAQAVAARTYAAWSRAQNRRRHYQICDTSSCQVYGGVSGEHPLANAAVTATRGRILTFGGRPAFTQFSSSSGGWTSAGSAPYLPAQADPYDAHERNPVNTWSVTVDVTRLERAYPAMGELQRIRVTSRDGHGEWSGRVLTLDLDGSRADRTISGDDFRWALGLRSTWFTIAQPG